MLLCAAVISSLRKKKLHQVRLDEDNTQLEKKRLLIEQKKNKQQRQFLLMLTHELKNSLSVMRLFVGMTPIQGKFSQLAEQSITDMSAIIDRSLEVDRLDHKEVELFTESVDLIELIQLLIDGSSDPNRISFDEDIGSCLVTTDRLLLKTVVNNLLDNSVKYSEQTSIIHITLKHSMDPRLEKEARLGAEVSISNHIPVDSSPDCSQVFEKYYRGPLANKLSGSGLGLYLAKSMTALIDADLRVSVMNTRIIFKLWLPL
jgi:signal transduction histidine kinase